MGEFNANEVVKISFGEKYQLDYLGKTNYSADELRFIPDANTILRINNFNHQPAWNKDLNDNEYRGILEVRKVDKDLVVINELPLEDYLKGLGEAANTDSTEKIKAVIVAARTYAKYYIEKEQKFPGKPYNIDDSPDVSQNYLGYGLEKRAPNVVAAVDVTKGEVVTYKGVIVKTPFFSQTDGTKTKSAKDVWGWTTTPYLVSVDDSSCKATKFLGHGVGLSGCGSQGMALLGFKYQDILKHYYTGVEITDQY
jgi:stage II sporulation protein D